MSDHATDRPVLVPDLVLSEAELFGLTGYQLPSYQLKELQRQGFSRARRSPATGHVILERAHYAAVCAGHARPANEPRVRPPRVQPRMLRAV